MTSANPHRWLAGAVLALSLVVPVADAEAAGTIVPTLGNINYGTVTVGSPLTLGNSFANVGDESVSISTVIPPNGFTVTSYPFGFINPNGGGSINVRLNAFQPGFYAGNVYIYYSSGLTSKVASYTVSGSVVCATSPSVSLTSPSNGSTVSPNGSGNVILSASASDPGGLSKVEFYVDGGLVATDTAAPWAYAWGAQGGAHSAFARAFNNCGASTTSASNSFTVDCGKPTVTWTGPAQGSTVSPNGAGNVILSASTSHSTGISRVEFWVDGSLGATDSTAPYAWAWPASSGGHTAYAVAYSNCPSVKITPVVSFTVN